jgi:putative transposase
LAAAERDEAAADEPGARAQTRNRFTVTPEVRSLLALWKGDVTAVHRELTARAARQSPPAAGELGELLVRIEDVGGEVEPVGHAAP